jgi:glycosyltransferase involved in cell wall biosynthesis
MQFVLPGTLARLRPDLCHFTNSIAPLRLERPYVLSLYDLSLFLHGSTQPLKSLVLIRPLIPICVTRAAAVITLTESSRRDIVNVLQVPEEKVHVVHGAAGPLFRPDVDAVDIARVRRAHALPDEFVLYVGTVEPRKNLDRLLQAFAHARHAGRTEHLVLAGQLGWKYESLLAQVERDGLRDAVHLLGYVDDCDLPALYALARVFAFPSHYEGFGLPIVESMACGTPVLTSDRPATAEVAGGAAVLVDPLDGRAMGDALTELLGDDLLRQRLRADGLARARSFSWARAAEETARVYRLFL